MWCNCTVIVRELLLHATTWLNLTKYYEVEEEDHEFGDSLGYIVPGQPGELSKTVSKIKKQGWECSSVIEHLPSTQKC